MRPCRHSREQISIPTRANLFLVRPAGRFRRICRACRIGRWRSLHELGGRGKWENSLKLVDWAGIPPEIGKSYVLGFRAGFGSGRFHIRVFGEETAMPWDAKLGLLSGAAVILTVALVYHRPEGKDKAAKDAGKATTGQRTALLSPMLPASVPERE